MQAPSLVKHSEAVVSQTRLAGLGALCAGALLIALVGFAPISAVHNAAHDTRHSSAFPCH